jgi:hypothetical protein
MPPSPPYSTATAGDAAVATAAEIRAEEEVSSSPIPPSGKCAAESIKRGLLFLSPRDASGTFFWPISSSAAFSFWFFRSLPQLLVSCIGTCNSRLFAGVRSDSRSASPASILHDHERDDVHVGGASAEEDSDGPQLEEHRPAQPPPPTLSEESRASSPVRPSSSTLLGGDSESSSEPAHAASPAGHLRHSSLPPLLRAAASKKQPALDEQSQQHEALFWQMFAPEQVLDMRVVEGSLEYRVKWKGWDCAHSTWERSSTLMFRKEGRQLVAQFHVVGTASSSARKLDNSYPPPSVRASSPWRASSPDPAFETEEKGHQQYQPSGESPSF